MPISSLRPQVPLLSLSLALGACAGLPADWGRGDVARLAADRGRALSAASGAPDFTETALRTPLSVDTAIQLALVNNPAVRREAARLGFAAAEVYDAGRLANPMFSMTRLSPGAAGAEHAQLTLGIAFNFVNLLFLPANQRFAQAQFEAAKLGVAAAALELAAQVETAWYEAAGAEQLAQMREATARAARASADLAQRYFDAGNINARALAMERAAASTAMLAAISARAEALTRHSQLNRAMGLRADQDGWTLASALAEPLAREDEVAELQRLSLESRLDVASLHRQAAALADRQGLARRTRWVNGVEIGAERERDFDGEINAGPTLAFELPLFDGGAGRVAAAQAALEQAEAELDARVLDVSNEVRQASARVNAAKQLAQEYRAVLIPQREAIVARAQEEQNYMLIGAFEVMIEKQQEYEAYAGYIGAVRDYWVARSELARAVGRSLPSSAQPSSPVIDAKSMLGSPPDGTAHHHSSTHGASHAGHEPGPAPAEADPSPDEPSAHDAHGDHR